MSEFFNDFEKLVKEIHIKNGVDNDAVTKEIADALTAGIAPLQTQLADQQTQIAELQKAVQETVTALTNGDTDAALAIVSTAADGSAPAKESFSAGEGSASGEAGAGQAAS